MICRVESCETAAWSQGYCPKHLYRFKRYGDPEFLQRPSPGVRLAFVQKAAASETDYCIIHDFKVGNHGYMVVSYQGSLMLGHHLVLLLQGRALPRPGEETRHICDNKRCLNPRHLVVGTPQDNADDRAKYGKVPRGSARPGSKLTNEDIKAIRAAEPHWGINSELARAYGVSPEVIRGIRNGTRWKHVE